jgi:hypothetical protein
VLILGPVVRNPRVFRRSVAFPITSAVPANPGIRTFGQRLLERELDHLR